MQLKDKLIHNDFFNVRINAAVDQKLLNSLKLLNQVRGNLLRWPAHIVTANALFSAALSQMKISNYLSAAGRQSIHYLAIHRRATGAKIAQLTLQEFSSIKRYLTYCELGNIIELFIRNQVPQAADCRVSELYPTNDFKMVSITKLTSKALR